VRNAGTVQGLSREDAPGAGADRRATPRSSRWTTNDLPCLPCPLLPLISRPIRRDDKNGQETAASHGSALRFLPNEPVLVAIHPQATLRQHLTSKNRAPPIMANRAQSCLIVPNQGIFILRLSMPKLFTSPGKTYSPTRPMSSPTRPNTLSFGGKPENNFFQKSACNHHIWGYTPSHSTTCGLPAAICCPRLSKQMWPLDGCKNRVTL